MKLCLTNNKALFTSVYKNNIFRVWVQYVKNKVILPDPMSQFWRVYKDHLRTNKLLFSPSLSCTLENFDFKVGGISLDLKHETQFRGIESVSLSSLLFPLLSLLASLRC